MKQMGERVQEENVMRQMEKFLGRVGKTQREREMEIERERERGEKLISPSKREIL